MMTDQKEFHSYDIRIASNGDWYHEGSKIKRFELVKLFASVLHYKEDKNYWLITPKEEGVIKVDDAPFIIKEINYKGNYEEGNCWVTTNLDETFLLGKKNYLRIAFDKNKNPRPYVFIYRGLEALMLRSVYYDMVNYAVKDEKGCYGIWSDKTFFIIDCMK